MLFFGMDLREYEYNLGGQILTCLNDRARDAIKQAQATTNFTEKRNLLGTAVFAMKPSARARMVGASVFNGLIDGMLCLKGKPLEKAVVMAASRVWL
jgi:hypothetical protein